MTAEENKALVRRFYKAFSAADEQALKAVLSPDLVAYSHGSPGPQGREEHVQGIAGWNAAVESEFTIEDQLAEGDRVATRVTMRAVHNRGPFFGQPPTGRESYSQGMSIERIANGRIVERRVVSDFAAFMQELGLTMSTQAAD